MIEFKLQLSPNLDSKLHRIYEIQGLITSSLPQAPNLLVLIDMEGRGPIKMF